MKSRKSLTLYGLWGQGDKQAKGLRRVKNTYDSVAEYLGVFEPLLFEEVKAQIVQGRSNEEEGARPRTPGLRFSCGGVLLALIFGVRLFRISF